MCRVLEVSTSGYYAWRQRGPSARAQADAKLQARIKAIHIESRGTYGRPRVHAELRADGVRVGGKRVARLMRREGVQGISRRRRVRTTRRNREARPVPDLVERNFTAARPDRLWVADIERHEALLNRVEMKGLRRGGCRSSPREAGGSLISET